MWNCSMAVRSAVSAWAGCGAGVSRAVISPCVICRPVGEVCRAGELRGVVGGRDVGQAVGVAPGGGGVEVDAAGGEGVSVLGVGGGELQLHHRGVLPAARPVQDAYAYLTVGWSDSEQVLVDAGLCRVRVEQFLDELPRGGDRCAGVLGA